MKSSLIRSGVTTILIIFFTTACASAQRDYETGIGLRAGVSYGLTVKHFMSERSAWEGILTTRWEGFLLTGLYELHQDVFNTTNFNFFYGVGGHLGSWHGDVGPHDWFHDGNQHLAIGVDGILGLEYTFDEVPFSISIDWKPSFNIAEHTVFLADEAGLSIRYAIK
ncbi:MAG TPA: hypothetical protein VE870_15715 [Bacteroidales bacterium]|nr:hypothetical protein [Bacteroidales bacterium]